LNGLEFGARILEFEEIVMMKKWWLGELEFELQLLIFQPLCTEIDVSFYIKLIRVRSFGSSSSKPRVIK
jgi:hypothetical protein